VHDESLDWHLTQYKRHQQVQELLRNLNRVYRRETALHALDCEPAGFEWVDGSDAGSSVLSFLRKSADGETVLAVFSFTPVPREGYRIGVPAGGIWQPVLNSDDTLYGGTGQGPGDGVEAEGIPHHGRPYSIELTLPPLAAVYLKSATKSPVPAEAPAAIEASASSS
jgi:1,4-alpha-glucan branching enzyme